MGPAMGRVWLLVLVCYAAGAPTPGEEERHVDLRMPNVSPQVVDTYLCHSLKLDKETYLTGFIPHANMSTAHHVLLYGCATPGSQESVWNCGEMEMTGKHDGPVCKAGSQIVYAWAMDAPMLHLPEGVGFVVGGKSSIQYLVLQVHYKDVSSFLPPKNGKDNSGLTLIETDTPQPKRAGVYLLGTGGVIPEHSTTYMETACSIDDPITLHPFAFRTHTHTHGEVVSGYRVRDGKWKEIGRQSPKKPQMFYNVTDPNLTIKKGDAVAARCTMVNNGDKPVAIGATQKDEMCNFYMMYYVNGPEILSVDSCFRAGPPHWYWTDVKSIQSGNVPADASMVPGTDKVLKETEKFIKETERDIQERSQKVRDEFNELMAEVAPGFWNDEEQQQLRPAYNGEDYNVVQQRAVGENMPLTQEELEQYYSEMYGL